MAIQERWVCSRAEPDEDIPEVAVRGICTDCGEGIYFHKNSPPDIPKICFPCAELLKQRCQENGEHFETARGRDRMKIH